MFIAVCGGHEVGHDCTPFLSSLLMPVPSFFPSPVQPRTWDNTTTVRAWVGEKYARLEGQRSTTAIRGLAAFDMLKFPEAGTFSLHLSINDQSHPSASARVVVLPTMDEQLRLQCLYIFDLMLEAAEPSVSGESAGLIPWPDSLTAAPCLHVFESSAFRAGFGPGGADLWVWYTAGKMTLAGQTLHSYAVVGTDRWLGLLPSFRRVPARDRRRCPNRPHDVLGAARRRKRGQWKRHTQGVLSQVLGMAPRSLGPAPRVCRPSTGGIRAGLRGLHRAPIPQEGVSSRGGS